MRITRACNNRCLFCLDKSNHDGSTIPIGEIRKILKKGLSEGAVRAIISGGEPTIHPNIIAIIAMAKKMGYEHVQIITNGRMLAYENFTKKMKIAGLDEVTFSLHSHSEKNLEEMTQSKNSYKQAIGGLMNALKNGFIVSIDIVINKINYKALKETVDFFIKLGVYEFDLLYLTPFGSAWKNKSKLFVSPAKVRKYIEPVLKMSSDKKLHIWTNRMPPQMLEGYEYLIQSPSKLKDEIAGMEEEIINYFVGGQLPACHGERCRYCFKKNFCQDMVEFREKGYLGSKMQPICLKDKKNKEKFISFEKKFDVFKFLDFYVKNRYFVKSLRCKKCKHNKNCEGAWIEDIRENGFAILRPSAINKRKKEISIKHKKGSYERKK